VSGRLVRTLVDAHQEPGSHELHWDRRASSGATVAAGVYFVHASIGGREGVEKVVVR